MISLDISETATAEVFPEQKEPQTNGKKDFICGHGLQATKDDSQ